LFDYRVESAAKAGGESAVRYKNYQDLLDAKNIDAVIIATPDHWHAQMILDAVKAGKHVYSEKCLTRTAQEAVEVFDTVSASGLTFQLGHQLRQTASYHAAKEVISRDMLGHISLIQTNSNRNSKNGAWVYDFHPDANANTIDWKQFERENKDRAFSLDRFFRWRKYWDYSTGLFGDLLTHDFDAINQIMSLGIPDRVMSSGGTYFWKDGREVPDVLQVVMEYPKKGLTYNYSATQANQRKRPNIIMGSDATMEIGSTMSVYPDRNSKLYREKLQSGELSPDKKMFAYNSNNSEFDGVSSATQKYFAEKGMMFTDVNGKRMNPTYLHVREWLDSIRNGTTPSCNIDQAFEEAIATHMSVSSFREQRMVRWDKDARKII
jgi:predicted dehydrogenase